MPPSPINPPHDILVQLAPTVTLPPMAKAGAMISCFGKYTSIDQNFLITYQCASLNHHTQQGATLDKLPTAGGKITFDANMIQQLQSWKAFGDNVSKYLQTQRTPSRAPSQPEQSPKVVAPIVRPTIGVPVIRQPIVQPVVVPQPVVQPVV